jgi:hypothetical protein
MDRPLCRLDDRSGGSRSAYAIDHQLLPDFRQIGMFVSNIDARLPIVEDKSRIFVDQIYAAKANRLSGCGLFIGQAPDSHDALKGRGRICS